MLSGKRGKGNGSLPPSRVGRRKEDGRSKKKVDRQR